MKQSEEGRSIKTRASLIGKSLFLRSFLHILYSFFSITAMRGLLALFVVLFGHIFTSVRGASLALDGDHVNQVLREKCSGGRRYTMPCLKLDSLRLLLLLGNETVINLGPGISLVGTEETASLIDELDASIIKQPRSLNQLDDFVHKMFRLYLGSLNLTFQLRDSHILDDAVSYLAPKSDVTGRAKRIGLSWFLLGTVAAVGFAVLAALTGAGLTAAILALILSGIASLRGGAAGYGSHYGYGAPPSHHNPPMGRITSFEFIKPAYVPTDNGDYILDSEHHRIGTYAGGKRGVDFDSSEAAN